MIQFYMLQSYWFFSLFKCLCICSQCILVFLRFDQAPISNKRHNLRCGAHQMETLIRAQPLRRKCLTSHVPNIPHPTHPTSRTSCIPNIPHIPHPKYSTSQTSHIPNMPHPKYPTSQTCHALNIPHLKHRISRKFHLLNIPHLEQPLSRKNTAHSKHVISWTERLSFHYYCHFISPA